MTVESRQFINKYMLFNRLMIIHTLKSWRFQPEIRPQVVCHMAYAGITIKKASPEGWLMRKA